MKCWKFLVLGVVCSVAAHGNDSLTQPTDTTSASTLHYVMHTEMTFAHPLSKLWPVFKDMRRWYTEYTFDVISGPPYDPDTGLAEGQVLKVVTSAPFPR